MIEWVKDTASMTAHNSSIEHTTVVSGAILLVAVFNLELMKSMSSEQLLSVANLLHIKPSIRENYSKTCPDFFILRNCLVENMQ